MATRRSQRDTHRTNTEPLDRVPGLGRVAPRLLRQVGGAKAKAEQEHGRTSADEEETPRPAKRSRPVTGAERHNGGGDVDREPEEDEGDFPKVWGRPAGNARQISKTKRKSDALESDGRKSKRRKSPAAETKDTDDGDDADEPSWIAAASQSSQQRSSAPRKFGGAKFGKVSQEAARRKVKEQQQQGKKKTLQNIHAAVDNGNAPSSSNTAKSSQGSVGSGFIMPTSVSSIRTTPQEPVTSFIMPKSVTGLTGRRCEEDDDPGVKDNKSQRRALQEKTPNSGVRTPKDDDSKPTSFDELSKDELPISRNSPTSSPSALSSLPSDADNDDDIIELPLPPPQSDTHPHCPLCDAPVDKTHWQRFSAAHPAMSYRQERVFCSEHRARSARAEWSRRGYPDVDWARLEDRMTDRDKDVAALLRDPQRSHYHRELVRLVDSGRSRTVFKHIETGRGDALSVGYYGVRGASLMTAHATATFAQTLHSLSITNPVVAARDVSGYVQMVVVPELATRLIMDDICVGYDEARGILEESKELGALLFPR